MTNIKALDGLATMIEANGGAEFCRGYIDASNGNGFSAPNIASYTEYTLGFISIADRPQLDFIARTVLPELDFTECDNDSVKYEIAKLIDFHNGD